jgi:EAL domain-containing protein (putative c-di-GMP-specific phosphodiesterase class I)
VVRKPADRDTAFDRLPLDRVLLELSEQDRVEDYDGLMAVLTPLRRRDMRLAIDDVGAGFSWLRHIVLTAPDVIKLDRSMIDGVSADLVRTMLVRSLVSCGHDCGSGWHFGRPAPAQDLMEPFPVIAADVPQQR